MTKKTQAQTPEEIAQAFMQLWQEKWNETLRQKGWPQDAAMPGIGQMPFFNPFMPQAGFGTSTDDARIKKLEERVALLEKSLKKTAEPKAARKTARPRKA